MLRPTFRIFLLISVLIVSVTSNGSDLCDPTSRHCFSFPEKDVDSTFDGVGQVDTPPVMKAPAPAPTQPEVSGSAARSTNGGGGGLNTASIVAMSVGGALLLVGAAAMRRRSMNGVSDLSAMDSTSVNPTGDEAA